MRIVLLLMLVVARTAFAESQSLAGATMGTTYHVKVVAVPHAVELESLQADVDKVLAEIDRQMSTWRSDSEVSRFNRAAADEWFAVSPAVAEVVRAAQKISGQTDGAIDVTVGPLVRLWQFGPDAKSKRRAPRKFVPPTDEAIAEAQKLVGYQKLSVRTDSPALRKEVNGLEIDLSSIASGFAIDRLAEKLAARGIKNYLVEIGGEVRAAGRRDDDKSWKVAIERPIPGKQQMQSVVPLLDAAIATAGDYQKFFEYDGRRYSHIIDPAAGRPVRHALASVTVVADTCTAADGWDTPLLVLGPKRGYECAEKNGIAALFIGHSQQADEIEATPAWQARFGDSKHRMPR